MAEAAAQVRPGTAADVSRIYAIEHQVSLNPWSLSHLLNSSRRDNEPCLVLESPSGELLGFAIYQKVLDEATLMNIAIAGEQQSRGHGARLLQSLLRELKNTGIVRCLLEVRSSNAAAIALYRKHGFVDDGRRKDYYPTATGKEDALLMSCQVSEVL